MDGEVVGPCYQTRKAVGGGTVGSADGGDLCRGGDGGWLAKVVIAIPNIRFQVTYRQVSDSIGVTAEQGSNRCERRSAGAKKSPEASRGVSLISTYYLNSSMWTQTPMPTICSVPRWCKYLAKWDLRNKNKVTCDRWGLTAIRDGKGAGGRQIRRF